MRVAQIHTCRAPLGFPGMGGPFAQERPRRRQGRADDGEVQTGAAPGSARLVVGDRHVLPLISTHVATHYVLSPHEANDVNVLAMITN